MGGCSSCCRPRRKSPEREPLIPKDAPHTEQDSALVKLADIIGALNAEKLPSHDQFASLLRHILHSEFLQPLQQGALLVTETRNLIDSLLRITLEKNYDDKLQDLLFQSTRPSAVKVSGELFVDGESVALDDASEDTVEFLQSLRSLAQLAITSSAFRMLINGILGTARETIAEAASEVGEIATEVQATAFDVAKTVETGNVTADTVKGKARESYAGLQQSVLNANRNIGTLGDNSAERVRELVVARVQEIAVQAHKDPKYRSALQTILVLFRKYAARINSIQVSGEPVTIEARVDASPPFHEALMDFKILLERLASGRSLDPLLRAFKAAIGDVLDAPSETGTEVARFFADLGRWLERALSEPQFAASRLGAKTAGELYDAARLLIASEVNAQWAHDVRLFVSEADAFLGALESDTATNKFMEALQSFLSALRSLVSSGKHKLQHELLKDILKWLIPRIFKSLKSLPVPRIEFQNNTFDVVIDALSLTPASMSASLAPDHMVVQNWSELKIDMASESATSSEMSTKTRIHIDGMRVGAHGFGYYFKYKGSPVQYSDQGLLDVDVGHPGAVGEGLAVDVDLETTQSERDTPGQPLFRLNSVDVAFPGLAFDIRQSKHWFVNNVLLQPLAAPVVRLLLKNVLEQQVRNLVEWADRVVSAVVEEATRINARLPEPAETPSLEDFWTATLLVSPAFFEPAPSASGPAVATHTEPTLTGIIHTTTTLAETSSPPEQTVLAVGAGAQLFPGKGGPYGSEEVTAEEVVHQAVDGLQQAAGKTREVVEGVGDEALRIRVDMEQAEERKVEREEFERRRGGWRSHAFDLD